MSVQLDVIEYDLILDVTDEVVTLNVLDGITILYNGVKVANVRSLDFIDGTNTTAVVTQVGNKVVVRINSTGGGGSGSSTFIGLTDVPATYVGQALKFTRVNAAENALEFTASSASVAWGGITGTLSDQTDLQAALDLKDDKLIGYEQHAAGATLNINHANKVFRYVGAGAANVTIPPYASVPFEIGTKVYLKRTTGAGALTVVQGAGVTITSSSGVLTDAGVNVLRILIKTATDAWDLDTWAGVGGSGDVVGPASAVADRIAVFDSTSGKLIKDGGVTVAGLQPIDADLTAIAALTSAADKLPYATGAQAWALTDLSSFVRTLLDDADAATARTTLGITAGVSRVVITSPVVNNNATPLTWESITGLSFPVVADKRFAFKFVIPYTSAATSNGGAFSISGPTLTITSYRSIHATANATFLPSYRNAYDVSTAPTASSATDMVATIEGIIECSSAASEVIARFQSELSGQAITALAYSYVEYVQIN